MKRTAQRTLAGIVAAVAAIYGVTMLWNVGYSAWSLAGSGSGGIGAVSSGLLEALVPLVIGAVTNRVLVRWARRAGGVVLALHRAHTIALLLLVVLVVFVVSSAVSAGLRSHFDVFFWIVAALIAGLTLAAQSLLLAAILALFANAKLVSSP